jgi:hypothetical protein
MVSVSRDMEEASDLVEAAVVVRESIEQTSQTLNVHQRRRRGKEGAPSKLCAAVDGRKERI